MTDAPHYSDDLVTLHAGDCLDVLRSLPDCSIDAVVCDPPYGLSDIRPDAVVAALTAWAQGDRERVPGARGFMGRSWDAFVPPPAVWDECLRVLRPGGHLLAFAGSRTADLMGLSIRMAGFEIRDSIMWVHGQGFPHGQNVGKAIDATLLHGGANSRRVKAANDESRTGGERVRTSPTRNNGVMGESLPAGRVIRDEPATPEAARWEGWNTSLRPAQEPIIVARKPLAESSVAANVLAHGTGALNVDACRVVAPGESTSRPRGTFPHSDDAWGNGRPNEVSETHPAGRWPANVVLSHVPSEYGGDACESGCQPGCPVLEMDRQSGTSKSPATVGRGRGSGGLMQQRRSSWNGDPCEVPGYGDTGGASRFFPVFRYQAKAPSRERPKVNGVAHPTTKPLELMKWILRLVVPPGGTALDPFAGSGTTLEAGILEGFHVIGVERQPEYLPLIEQRIERAHAALAARADAEAKTAEPTTGTLFDVA